MNPIKSKEISKRLAKKLNKDEALVDDVVNFFYKHLREGASNVEALSFKIPKFGYLNFRYYRSESAIQKNERMIDIYNKDTPTQASIREAAQNNVDKINKARAEYEKMIEDKNLIKQKRMLDKLEKIWNNKSKIIEGIKNNTFKQEAVEQIAEARLNICASCPKKDIEGSSCMVPGTQPCCAACGCKLAWKVRSLSENCPEGKWKEIVSFEEETEINDMLNKPADESSL